MKKRLIGVLSAALILSVGTLSAGAAYGPGGGARWVDANKDGICDNRGANWVDANGDGICDNCNTAWVDANGDGICDNRGTNWVDANGDGVCDNQGTSKSGGARRGGGCGRR